MKVTECYSKPTEEQLQNSHEEKILEKMTEKVNSAEIKQ